MTTCKRIWIWYKFLLKKKNLTSLAMYYNIIDKVHKSGYNIVGLNT